ncbi:alpha/beta fold hydrolase [Nocardia sp. NBC_00565]|uniref:alpha/beta hydrolase family protein n=1 Tax=Nocardia sp. NBC_00565 TaxID=2975993 RepID=UPI002E8098E2|nr:alpha/beta fold hydrolase [Nocardia sp. NBC_00565]WUC00096.1 alpha/beta fold hydrolase [Nocardia sp. NBC_00565]
MRTGRMVVAVVFFIVAAVAGCSSSESGPSGPVRGDWRGAIEVPGAPLAVGVSFADNGTAAIDIPLQGVNGVELKDVSAEPDRVEFAIPNLPGDPKFQGKYDKGSNRIVGEFRQAGQSLPLRMEPGKIEPPARPQEPKPPFPYRSDDVTYHNGDITIAGTLTRPEGNGPFPAVLLLSGSGAQDRNEELMGHKPFLLVADTLTRAGYAVLRADDRGIGGTSGKLDDANYSDLVNDAAAGLSFLRARPEIDPARVGLFGHSEGGYLAPLVASRPDSGVAFAILMAGPSVPAWDVLIEQNRALLTAGGAPQSAIDEQVTFITEWTTLIRSGDLAGAKDFSRRHNESLPPDQRASAETLDAYNTTYMASFIVYDPAPALSALRIPVLAFYGTKDMQVLATQNEQPMRDRLAADPDATVHVFPDLNHLMQPATSGLPSEYTSIETTISPDVLTYVTEWLTQRVPTH